jgi:hypothetical protein
MPGCVCAREAIRAAVAVTPVSDLCRRLEAKLKRQLQSAWTVSIDRMQE